ncbi:hypothetical protein BC938DRAFT_470982 [Jimgerdemannia flammicorona]|uniref:Uncharacterized protein n=1 Tax=Jimgerdemannia flammicorona TaxID=994334 RepID=A0A433Q916_9FUNG|nr:hypothetical protein BC938DRAFT_470982 [Jimgerdemannia flammicorona]
MCGLVIFSILTGTGTTTTIVFRMLGLCQAYHRNAGERLYKSEFKSTHLHQIFLTQSAVLCTRERSHFWRLLQSTDPANLSKEEILLAAKRGRIMDQDSTNVLMIEDDDKELLADVPMNMGDLRDEHFPLFLTVSRFLEMLEVTYGIRHTTAEPPTARRLDVQQMFDTEQAWARYITYEVFESKYWPRMNKKHTKHLDCALVFTHHQGFGGCAIYREGEISAEFFNQL